ncbi:MAG: CRISPR-associated endonuclease Cas4/Cas1 [Candidatus Methylomirabilis oxygeniifera]|uniref:CRISPR-associated endonuclease Cas1 n=1 Tax=Methylomirabilis oxygeniifera TaxID=671143 RepID=D5MKW8_METO1|nr:MAG: CRISPR-associated endonuclease Cas4/Cas1 [Candidatus Methylomirabilis oxyfera]CBE69808.1 CRISPR-associated protein Cas1/Cas4 [Candidatus Methylomirabilis oxyfera]
MLNEFAYCPRLCYLEWVQGEFADSADTVEGRLRHRTVDRGRQRQKPTKEETGEPEAIHERSVHLTSDRLGLTAKVDLIEGEGNQVTPVDYKRGKRPHLPQGAYEPERVQVCAQGLILRDNGFLCDNGVIYFAGSKERVTVEFDEVLVERTLELAGQMTAVARGGLIPPPLDDSPKCPRCSLVGICLPDEVRLLKAAGDHPVEPRLLFPARDDALPLHVQHQGARIKKDGNVLQVWDEDALLAEARLEEVSHLVLFGGVHASTPVIHELCQRGIPISYLSHGGWLYGITQGLWHKNVELRRRQYDAASDPQRCLALAQRFVRAKIANCRTLLRRNHPDPPEQTLRDLKEDMEHAARADRMDSLLGIEGTAAHRYFSNFGAMLRGGDAPMPGFDFQQRNRRPPRDPVNAMLSFAYALLTREWTTTLQAVGFDPFLGFYHQPRYGRPALALDLMEEFRSLIGDSVVLMAVNNGEVRPQDFISIAGSVSLTPSGRTRFIEAYERRMSQEISHPIFGYRISYRRVLEVQARLLGRYLAGEIPEYPSFTTR